jgi:hypothetical protein
VSQQSVQFIYVLVFEYIRFDLCARLEKRYLTLKKEYSQSKPAAERVGFSFLEENENFLFCLDQLIKFLHKTAFSVNQKGDTHRSIFSSKLSTISTQEDTKPVLRTRSRKEPHHSGGAGATT